MRHVELALETAEQVLNRPRRPVGIRDAYGVRGLAAYILWATGGGSWADVAEALYRGRAHTTAYTGAKRWVGTAEARAALDSFKSIAPARSETDVWGKLRDLEDRFEQLSARVGGAA